MFISRIWRKINLPFPPPGKLRRISFKAKEFFLLFSSLVFPYFPVGYTCSARGTIFFPPVLWKVGAPPFPSTFEEFFLGTRAEERGGGGGERRSIFFCCRRSLFSLCLQLRRRVLYARAPIFFPREGRSLEKKRDIFVHIIK